MRELLDLEEEDVRFIGISGMGGLGKTTLAKLVFDRISHQFEVAEILVDVRKSLHKIVELQKHILSSVMKDNVSQVWDEDTGTTLISRCLSNKKVLLIVDDVISCDILQKLAGEKSWFGVGSRVIVTTRDKRILTEHGIDLSLEPLRLPTSEALKLFSHKAFKKDQPEEGFLELSKCFVDYAKGLPLALKILGSSLYQRTLAEWNSALDLLKRNPNPGIFDTLKLSYDALDYWQKEIFLDIAFFQRRWRRDRLIDHLQICYNFNSLIVINTLIEKSLLTTDQSNFVEMHELIREMAEEIVRQEGKEPGERSRLRARDDIFHVFRSNTGTGAIKGIHLRPPVFEARYSNWNWDCFTNMHKLMFLECDNLRFSSGPKFLPNSLIVLRWNHYPSRSLPESFQPYLLTELIMRGSRLVQLWDGRQDLPNLRFMDLRRSKNLKKTVDFTGIPNLFMLRLDSCESLIEVHPSVAFLKKLVLFTLSNCKNLEIFPKKIEMDSLSTFELSYCSKLKVPEFGEGMVHLWSLEMDGTATEELPPSLEHMNDLTYLFMRDIKSLQTLPSTIMFKLKSLEKLHMERCPNLKTFLEITEERKGLKAFIGRKLRSLKRKRSPEPLCSALPSPRVLPSLLVLSLSDCNLCEGVIPDDIGYCMPSLRDLLLDGNNFVTVPTSIKCLSMLYLLNVSRCKRLKRLPDLPLNGPVKVLTDDCDSLEK